MKTSIIAASLLGATGLGITLYPHAQNFVNAATPVAPPAVAVSTHSEVAIGDSPIVDVVFALDTTGSMGGMIEAAKEKIWSIASTMANAQNAPQIRVGLVAYRDRGDAYVTRRFDLSDDLDTMFASLMQFQAAGGGDGPESVNQALYEAVTEMSWSENQNAYKVVFLVGDAPAHMDYQNDVKFDVTAKLAKEKGIVLNTIQCGEHQRVTAEWQQIAQLGSGQYFQVEQSGSAVAVTTPYDEKIAELSRRLDDTRLFYGDDKERKRMAEKSAATDTLHAKASVASRARRAAFNATASGEKNLLGDQDLVRDLEAGTVTLNEVAEDHLPASLQALPAPQRQAEVERTATERRELKKKIEQLSRKREAYAKSEVESRGGAKDSLDSNIFATIRKQGADKGLHYSDDAVRY